MSLIQDELKRKTEEQHPLPNVPPPPAPTQPEVEPPAQPAPTHQSLEPMNSSMKKLFIILVAVVVVILILIGSSIYIYLNAPERLTEEELIEEPAAPVEVMQSVAILTSTEEESVDNWPDLRFSGSAVGGNQILAIINGRMLSIGKQINGANVLKIGKTEVLVEFEGEKRILRVDE